MDQAAIDRLRERLANRRQAMVERLREWVEHESPSRDKPALDALAARIAERFAACGGGVARADRVPGWLGRSSRVASGPFPPVGGGSGGGGQSAGEGVSAVTSERPPLPAAARPPSPARGEGLSGPIPRERGGFSCTHPTGSGGSVERVANPDGGDHVLMRFFDGQPGKPALVLGHFDTVWPVGTLASMPFRIEDGRAYGPGSFDMKASLVLVEFAVQAMSELGMSPPRPVVVLFTSDEEIGSPSSRPIIEGLGAEAAFALVLESPLPGGRLKTARKGVGGFTIAVHGRAAHAGIEPEKGASAIIELAHQVLKITALGDPERGTTLNVGLIEGGTAANVVPALAKARVDVRASRMDEALRVERGLRSLAPITPGTSLSIEGGFNRPPMERSAAMAALFEQARTLGRLLGQDLTEGSTGGASDANFTAALGVPTLDGLGALGHGAHAVHEHIVINSLPERAALLAVLLLGLLPPSPRAKGSAS
jgi:glutamate carboxypeptidase